MKNISKNDKDICVTNKETRILKIINHYPKDSQKNLKEVERKLFEVFKKYEKQG